MFPLKANDPYIKATGERSTLGSVVGGGGSDTPELPDYSIADAGKVLTVDDEGSLEWLTNSGGGNIYKGTTVPSNSLGNEGDIYLLVPTQGIYQNFEIDIKKAIRGTTETNYYGAQEIQLLFTNGEQVKDISEFTGFSYSGPGSISYAFNGQTDGNYWETSGFPGIVTFGAIIPIGWTPTKLVVWQRNSESYLDVWKEFTFSVNDSIVLVEQDLTTDDWAGPGNGTEFEFTPVGLKNIQTVYYKVDVSDEVVWIS